MIIIDAPLIFKLFDNLRPLSYIFGKRSIECLLLIIFPDIILKNVKGEIIEHDQYKASKRLFKNIKLSNSLLWSRYFIKNKD